MLIRFNKIAVIDFTGKSEFYNIGLGNELIKNKLINYYSPHFNYFLGLLNNSTLRSFLVPPFILFQYLKFIFFYKVIHYQWLPFEKIFLDTLVLRIFKFFKKKVIITAHNILPHDSGDKYLNFYKTIYELCDLIIVHDLSAKLCFQNKFPGLKTEIIIINHGVENKIPDLKWDEKRNDFLIFGHIKKYKGVIKFLNKYKSSSIKEDYKITIAGKVSPDLKPILTQFNNDSFINIKDDFLSEKVLEKYLYDFKFTIFPYQKITTSGSVLKAISHGSIPICSNLDFFENLEKEIGLKITYNDFEDLKTIVDGFNHTTYEKYLDKINKLIDSKYSWSKISKYHLIVYNKISTN